MHLAERLLNLIAPHNCLGCRRDGSLLCLHCATNLPVLPSRCYRCGRITEDFKSCESCRKQTNLCSLFVATTYEGIAKHAIHKLKFERARAGAADIAEVLAARGWELSSQVIVTHVPTATTRVRQRGYDQAALIARGFAREQALPYAPLLARLGAVRQVGSNAEARRVQMRQAFRPLRSYMIQNATLLLIDDVLTTGSTLEAAAAVLKAAGARCIQAAVFTQA